MLVYKFTNVADRTRFLATFWYGKICALILTFRAKFSQTHPVTHVVYGTLRFHLDRVKEHKYICSSSTSKSLPDKNVCWCHFAPLRPMLTSIHRSVHMYRSTGVSISTFFMIRKTPKSENFFFSFFSFLYEIKSSRCLDSLFYGIYDVDYILLLFTLKQLSRRNCTSKTKVSKKIKADVRNSKKWSGTQKMSGTKNNPPPTGDQAKCNKAGPAAFHKCCVVCNNKWKLFSFYACNIFRSIWRPRSLSFDSLPNFFLSREQSTFRNNVIRLHMYICTWKILDYILCIVILIKSFCKNTTTNN
jgi:hypothetical protein